MNSVVGNYSVKSNYQLPAFKGSAIRFKRVPFKDPLEHIKCTKGGKIGLRERIIEMGVNLISPIVIKVAPEKTFEKLGARLKKEYYASRISHFFDIQGHINNLMMRPPKEYEKLMPKYNPQEAINDGYEFVMRSKDNLEKLSVQSQGKNADFIKGMLKALKELGLVK